MNHWEKYIAFIVQSYHYLSIFSIQLGKKLINTLKVNSGIKERKTAITIFSYEIVIYYSKHKWSLANQNKTKTMLNSGYEHHSKDLLHWANINHTKKSNLLLNVVGKLKWT